jgi:hypothetical protein
MNSKVALLALTALAFTAGCNRGAGNNNSASANNAAPSNASTTDPAPSAGGATTGQAVDSAFLTANSWAPAGRCNEAVKFNADGTAQAGGSRGGWTLSGGTLTMTKAGEPDQQIAVTRAGNDLLMNMQGREIVASPCPAGSGEGAAGAEANSAEDTE